MAIIGLESSAHTFGVGIVDEGKILANEKSMYSIGKGGMIPAKVAEHHIESARDVIVTALEKAGLEIREIEGVGYTRGPGIGPCLQVAQISAKTIAKKLGIRVAMVNHSVGHIEITNHLMNLKDPIIMYVSGGNSQILKRVNKPFSHYSVLGETFDIGVGNMLDSLARQLKLDPAWGSSIEKTAKGGKYIDLPYTVKGMDFSFTGLLTKATELIGKESDEDICMSVQETAFSMLCEALERAMMLTNSNEINLCGGVAQNTRLQNMLQSVADEHDAKFGCADREFNADNGAMIAYVAEKMLKHEAYTKLENCDVKQKYRVDSAMVYGR
ncbi:MAG: tRNA (adenosine(37)-N6)-threonylcarbamoyltransferase complex transferase subunit TsaD [Candidatus Marsarchaeota archaeon]|jgi:glycoprotease/Kae1 family metallohydrolase|nr:tRNA (adenosine(37)-N6)-threonylcarbamoyltransferase complex transferase subunit TsaD [Candidatus Marsarchaeota archaeon]